MSHDYDHRFDAVLFPHGEVNLIPGMQVDTTKYAPGIVRYPRGMLTQRPFHQALAAWPHKVTQAPTPPPPRGPLPCPVCCLPRTSCICPTR
jgi:hypothetical protein